MMRSTKDRSAQPDYWQLMEAMSGVPQTSFLQLAPGYDKVQKMSEKKRSSLAGIAVLMGTTQGHIK